MSWPTVLAQPDPEPLAARMRHLCTSVTPGMNANDCVVGQTMFGCDCQGEQIGVAWDWIALKESVLVITDPMTILSNLQFVDAEGSPQPERCRILHLNDLVANMPWQPAVKAAAMLRAESRRCGDDSKREANRWLRRY